MHSYEGQSSRFIKRLLVVFVILTCVKVWIGPTELTPSARGQVKAFDSGAQRRLLLDEARKTNRLLGEIIEVLESGMINVRIQSTDNKQTGSPQTDAAKG